MKNKLTYDEAARHIEEIVTQLESGQVDIGQMGQLLKEAKTLLAQCQAELGKIESNVRKILE